jgi:2-polyprenyl-3-methyl-5-hydroxy-6-metoxy-1,4-benzoquinol methylase
MLRDEVKKLILPVKFREMRKFYSKDSHIKILDIGCGNHSPVLTKQYFPMCQYHGVDIVDDYNLDDNDKKMIDSFYMVTEEGGGYEKIHNHYYDIVVMNHVIEHMSHPREIFLKIINKVAPGGIIWVAFPSEKSLSLPSAASGSLHFSDDGSHVYVPSMIELCNLLLDNKFKIKFAGQTKDTIRWWVGFFRNLFNRVFVSLGMIKLSSKDMWYYFGFETSIVAVRRKD